MNTKHHLDDDYRAKGATLVNEIKSVKIGLCSDLYFDLETCFRVIAHPLSTSNLLVRYKAMETKA